MVKKGVVKNDGGDHVIGRQSEASEPSTAQELSHRVEYHLCQVEQTTDMTSSEDSFISDL